MPIYVYICEECGIEFDFFTSVENRHNVEHCGKPAIKKIGNPKSVMIDSNYRDARGTPIYFPSVGSHYDRALDKTFHSKKEKAAYMKDHKLIMDGSTTHSRVKQEAISKCEKGVPLGSN